jgi:hypothetical protein
VWAHRSETTTNFSSRTHHSRKPRAPKGHKVWILVLHHHLCVLAHYFCEASLCLWGHVKEQALGQCGQDRQGQHSRPPHFCVLFLQRHVACSPRKLRAHDQLHESLAWWMLISSKNSPQLVSNEGVRVRSLVQDLGRGLAWQGHEHTHRHTHAHTQARIATVHTHTAARANTARAAHPHPPQQAWAHAARQCSCAQPRTHLPHGQPSCQCK